MRAMTQEPIGTKFRFKVARANQGKQKREGQKRRTKSRSSVNTVAENNNSNHNNAVDDDDIKSENDVDEDDENENKNERGFSKVAKAIATASLMATLSTSVNCDDAFAAQQNVPDLPQPTRRSTVKSTTSVNNKYATTIKKPTVVTNKKGSSSSSSSLDKSGAFSDEFRGGAYKKSSYGTVKTTAKDIGAKPLTYDATKVDRTMMTVKTAGVEPGKKGTKVGAKLTTQSPTPVYAGILAGLGVAGAKGAAGKAAASKAASAAAKSLNLAEAASVFVAGAAAGELGKSSVNKAKKNVRVTPKGELSPGAQLLTAASIPATLVSTLVVGMSELSTAPPTPPSEITGKNIAEKSASVVSEAVKAVVEKTANKIAPDTQSSEAKARIARDQQQKAADAKISAQKKSEEAKKAAEVKKEEAMKVAEAKKAEAAKKAEESKAARESKAVEAATSKKSSVSATETESKKAEASKIAEAKKSEAAKKTEEAKAIREAKAAEAAAAAAEKKAAASTTAAAISTPPAAGPIFSAPSFFGNKTSTTPPPPPPSSSTELQDKKETEKKALEDALEAKLEVMRASRGKKSSSSSSNSLSQSVIKRTPVAAPAPVIAEKPNVIVKTTPVVNDDSEALIAQATKDADAQISKLEALIAKAKADTIAEQKAALAKKTMTDPSPIASNGMDTFDFGSFFSQYMETPPKKVIDTPAPIVVVEKPKAVVVEKPKPVIVEKPKPVAYSSSDDLSVDFGSFFSQYMETPSTTMAPEKSKIEPSASAVVTSAQSSAEQRKLGVGKANFSNMPQPAAKAPKEKKVVEKVKPTYTFERSGPGDKEGFKSTKPADVKAPAPTKSQSLVTAIAGAVGFLITFVKTRDPNYEKATIDLSKTTSGKVEYPARKFAKQKWGGEGIVKKDAAAKKTTTTTTTKKTTDDNSAEAQKWIDAWKAGTKKVELVPKARTIVQSDDAGKWIDAWKAGSSTKKVVAVASKSTQESDAEKWIQGWSLWSKEQVGNSSANPYITATEQERKKAEEWISNWKASGSPTDESRKEDAKKWIDNWKNDKN
jgi:hypothetical protein